jgi:hypothetical protein
MPLGSSKNVCSQSSLASAIGGGSGQLVEKEINGGNSAVPGNDEISPGVSW